MILTRLVIIMIMVIVLLIHMHIYIYIYIHTHTYIRPPHLRLLDDTNFSLTVGGAIGRCATANHEVRPVFNCDDKLKLLMSTRALGAGRVSAGLKIKQPKSWGLEVSPQLATVVLTLLSDAEMAFANIGRMLAREDEHAKRQRTRWPSETMSEVATNSINNNQK